MDNPALMSEMIKRAARENAALVEPVGRTDTPAQAVAQPSSKGSKLANLLYFAGLGGDVATTAYGTASGKGHEANPAVKWAGDKAAAPLVAGGGIATYLLARKILGDKHPKLLNGILMGMGGVHGAAALSNLHQFSQSAPAQAPSDSSQHPGMVQAPDGSWYDPNFLTLPGK